MEQIMQHDTAGSGRPVAGRYRADLIGAPFAVYLTGGYTVREGLGDQLVTIIDLPGLIATVVQLRVLHPRKLSGPELKFLRTALRAKSKTIADAIDLTPEHYSRCETGQKVLSPTTEKTLRAHAFLSSMLRDQEVQDLLKTPPTSLPVPKKKAEKALAAFTKIFMEMKIESVADTQEELVFTCGRRERNRQEISGSDNGPEWETEEPKKVA